MVRRLNRNDDNFIGAFVVGFTIIFIFIVGAGWDKDLLWGDAGDYYALGKSIWSNGRFSLLNMETGFRGYIYPLYLGICDKVGGVWGYRCINSLLICLLFWIIVPQFNGLKFGFRCKKRIWGAVLLSFLVFSIFYYGLEIYPLTDLMAIFLCMAAVVLENKSREEKNNIRQIIFAFLMGIMIYWMYNVRTIYLFAGVYLVLMFFWHLYKASKRVASKVFSILSMVGGIGLAGLPQGYMNYFQCGEFSIKVPTSNLMLKQIYWGILYQRYETAYRDFEQFEQHPSYAIQFVDAVGQALINKYEIEGFSTWQEVLNLIWKHPFDVGGIYIRHLVNMLFPCWPGQYVENLDSRKLVLAFLAYLFFFLFGIIVFNKCMKALSIISNYFALLIPVFFILPGAVEARYFAPLYLVITGIMCYNTNWIKVKEYVCFNKVKVAINFMIIGMLLLAIWTNMLVSESNYNIFFI